MKKLFYALLLLLILTPVYSFAKDGKDYKQIFTNYTDSGYYKIANGQLYVTKIIKKLPYNKDELFSKCQTYLTNTEKDSIQANKDKDDDSGILIYKGSNANIFDQGLLDLATYTLGDKHTLRIDIKNHKIRATYFVDSISVDNHDGYTKTFPTLQYVPFTNKKPENFLNMKKSYHFYVNLIDNVNELFNSLEKSIRSDKADGLNDNW